MLNSPNTSPHRSQDSRTQCMQTRFPGHPPWLFLIISCYCCGSVAGRFAGRAIPGTVCVSLQRCAGQGTQRDPILERIAVENPDVPGGSASSGSGLTGCLGHSAQMGREMLGLPCPTTPSLFSAETPFPYPPQPVLLRKGFIYHTDGVTLALKP